MIAATVRRRLLRNTAWYGGVTVLGVASGLLMSVVLARGLGPARMGDFSYIGWAMRLLECMAALGFGLATVRYTASALAEGAPGLARGFLRLFVGRQLAATAVVLVLVVPGVWLFASADLRWPFVVAALTLVPLTLEGVYMRATYGAQRYDVTARVSALKMTLSLAATAAALAAGAGILGIVTVQLLVTALSCGLQRRGALALYPTVAAPVPAERRRELRAFLIPLSVVVVLEMLVWDRSEVFFLRFYVPPEQIAFYSLAFGLAARAMIPAGIVVGALLPALSALHTARDDEEFGLVYRRALRHAGFVGAGIAAVLGALAPGVIVTLYGEAYRPVATLFRLLVGVGLLGALKDVAWAALQAGGDRRSMVSATVASVILDLVLAVALIPAVGTPGAVVATSVAQVTSSLWAFVAVHRIKRCAPPFADLARIAACLGLGAAATWLAAPDSASVGHLGLAAAAGGAAYLAAGLVTGAIADGEWRAILRVAARVTAARSPA